MAEVLHQRIGADEQHAAVYFDEMKLVRFHLPYAGLADAYSMPGEYTGRAPTEYRPQAKATAMKALEMDEALAEAHASLAYLKMRDWDWADVEGEFKRALEIDQSFAQAHHTPGNTYLQPGMSEEAFRELQQSRRLDNNPWVVASLGRAFAVSGRGNEARGRLAELKGRSKQSRIPPEEVARVYAALGEREQALTWLEKAYEEHSDHLAFVKVDPAWDSLRSDPRFVDILRRVGLVQ